jgi:hypothetical protein
MLRRSGPLVDLALEIARKSIGLSIATGAVGVIKLGW